MFDLEAREEGDVVAIALDSSGHVRHHVQHELPCLFINVVGVDEDLTDVRVKVVSNGPNDEAGFLVDQVGARLQATGVVDCLPELQQVVQIPL